MKDSLWSIDFFRAESITIKSHWIMTVMDQFTRRIIGFATHCGDLNGVAICCMFNKIIARKQLYVYAAISTIETDPPAELTAACSIVESLCKYILKMKI